MRTKAHEKFERKGMRIHGLRTAQIVRVGLPHIISGTARVKLELQIWQVYSQGPSEQKPLKNLGEKSLGVFRDCAHF